MHMLKVVIDVGYFQVLLDKEVIINLNQGGKEEMTLFNQEFGGNGNRWKEPNAFKGYWEGGLFVN